MWVWRTVSYLFTCLQSCCFYSPHSNFNSNWWAPLILWHLVPIAPLPVLELLFIKDILHGINWGSRIKKINWKYKLKANSGEFSVLVIDSLDCEHTGTLTLRVPNCDFIDYHFYLVYTARVCWSLWLMVFTHFKSCSSDRIIFFFCLFVFFDTTSLPVHDTQKIWP